MKYVMAAAMLAISGAASAQDHPPSLGILVESTGRDAAQCGVSQEGVTAAIRSAMRYNRIAEVAANSPMVPVVYFLGTVLKVTNDICAGNWSVSIEKYNRVRPTWSDKTLLVTEQFCQHGGMLSGPDFSPRFAEAIKEAFDRCLSKIVNNKFPS
jgi:hypothetical protein